MCILLSRYANALAEAVGSLSSSLVSLYSILPVHGNFIMISIPESENEREGGTKIYVQTETNTDARNSFGHEKRYPARAGTMRAVYSSGHCLRAL